MTAPLRTPRGEVAARMEHPSPTSEPEAVAEPEAATEPRHRARRSGISEVTAGAATSAPLLIALVAALVGVVGVMLGAFLFLIDGDIDDLNDRVHALEVRMDARFAEQDVKIEGLEARMDARFAEQDVKIEGLDAKMDAGFAALRNSQTELDRKLAVLIAHLSRTEAVDAALEGTVG